VWGTSLTETQHKGRISVHPHVCGEHTMSRPVFGSLVGSSPRVWGTFLQRMQDAFPARFIPTCVGNIHGSDDPSGCTSVHPHVCGEHETLCLPPATGDGSSPRVWGTCTSP